MSKMVKLQLRFQDPEERKSDRVWAKVLTKDGDHAELEINNIPFVVTCYSLGDVVRAELIGAVYTSNEARERGDTKTPLYEVRRMLRKGGYRTVICCFELAPFEDKRFEALRSDLRKLKVEWENATGEIVSFACPSETSIDVVVQRLRDAGGLVNLSRDPN